MSTCLNEELMYQSLHLSVNLGELRSTHRGVARDKIPCFIYAKLRETGV